jgi:hypothetical protein
MAESKFLKYQDKDGNFLIDVCDAVLEVAEAPCEESVCLPSATAVVPNWQVRKSLSPFLNEKICHYQVPIETSYTTTIEERLLEDPNLTEEEADGSLNERFEEHIEEAVTAFIESYNKDDGEGSKAIVREAIIWDVTTDYFLEARAQSRLRLLYSLPYEVLNNLTDALPETDDGEASPIEVTYEIDDLKTKLTHVRKALRMYSWYNKVYIKTDGSNFYYDAGPKEGSVFNLEDYGDFGVLNGSKMAKILPELDEFLNSKGYNIGGVGKFGGFTKDKVTKVIFGFSEEYELIKMTIYAAGCSETPVVFDDRLAPLKREESWSDPTAMAYLAQLDDMIIDLTAREPLPWLEFITKYTYPTVYSTINKGYANTDPQDSVGSCVADTLAQEGKQLGENILDEVFSIGDAIAYQFHRNRCSDAPDKILEEWAQLGLVWDPDANPGETVPLRQMATQQSYETLCADDQSLTEICSQFDYAESLNDIDEIWNQLLSNIKFCGMSELLMGAIQCLFGGVSFEEAMSTVIESALRAMSLENFDKLFVGLPPEKQAELEALAKKKLESGDVFKTSSTLQQTSDSLEGKLEIEKLWEDKDMVEAEQEAFGGYQTQQGTQERPMWGDPEADEISGTDASRRTLAKQFDEAISGTGSARASNNVLMEAWIQAYLELFSENYHELLDHLNKLPGAQIVAYLIATLDCPQPPILNPSGLDFIKSIEAPFCGNTFDLTYPKIRNPFEWYPKSKDFMSVIFDAARYVIQQAILKIIIMIMVKICEIMGNAACDAIGAGGAALASLASGGRTKISDAIRDSICGDEVDQEQIDDTVVDMLSTLGLGAAAMADTEQVLNLAGDISSAVTTEELYGAFLCEPSPEFLTIVRQIVQYDYPDLAEALKGEEDIKSFFCNMGNLMPEDFKDQMKNILDEYPGITQIASLCPTPEEICKFNDLRSEILGDRATPDQLLQMCEPNDDLADLSNLAQGGLPSLPPMVSDPGCNNGILPFEPDEAIAVVSVALNNMLEQLKVDFTYDMIGNGPFEKKWGLMNMVLSDTMGKPLTAHLRKSFNQKKYVDFYMAQGLAEGDEVSAFTLFPDPPLLIRQRGAFPTKIAEWLQEQLGGDIIKDTFKSNNEFQALVADPPRPLSDVGVETASGVIDPLRLDDDILGYNTSFTIADETITFIEEARKLKPDFTLEFRDNCKGLQKADGGVLPSEKLDVTGDAYLDAFNLEIYLSEMVSDDGTIGLAHNLGSQPAQPWAITSINDDHAHTYTVDVNNNGTTSYTDGHEHEIILGVVQEADDHTHLLEGVKFSPEFTSLPRDTSRIKITGTENDTADIGTTWATMVPVNRTTSTGIQTQAVLIPKNEAEDAVPISNVRYEFLSIDNTLEGMKFDDYPDFVSTFRSYQDYLPQVVLLKEMLGSTIMSSTLALAYDEIMQALLEKFIEEVAANDDSFEYGAVFDDLSYEDVEYVLANDLEGASTVDGAAAVAGTNYYDVRIPVDEDDPRRPILGSERRIFRNDQIMGISRMQHNEETLLSDTPNRVFYLDPLVYGGSYVNPPIHIKPLQNKGWLGLIDVMFPEISPCKPYATDLIDFEDIQKKMDDAYPNIPEDPRLQDDPDCAVEVPYNRILDRSAAAALEGLIAAAIRIYVSTNLIKSMSTFTRFKPSFPDVFSSIYASYIVEDMKASFKDPVGIFQGPFKNIEFWYAFLEQTVQLYGRKVDDGEIFDPPESVIEALNRLNDIQESYVYPDREAMEEETGTSGRPKGLGLIKDLRLRRYRETKNYEAIQATEEDAKLIFKELVIEQLNYMGEKFAKNLEIIGMTPDVYDLDYYLLQELAWGGEGLDLGHEIVESYTNLPIVPYEENEEAEGPYYTGGSEFATPDGSGYVGYYHVTTDEEDGSPLYLTGEFDTDAEHDILTPFANKIEVMIGDIESYPATEMTDYDPSDTSKPFIIEKYISINGTKMAPATAVGEITNTATNPDQNLNISDVYPGDMELVTDTNGQVVGLTGELGVRYGLRFSVIINSAAYPITEVEVDSLDLQLAQVDPFNENSKLLLCLINMLKEDEKFRLIAHYIFPLNKLTAAIAMYNGEAFLASIGEKVVPVGDANSGEMDLKPGSSVSFTSLNEAGEEVDADSDKVVSVVTETDGVDGWAHKVDRGLGTPFVLEWDDWGQTLLCNSQARIKKMFKSYYNSRTWAPGAEDDSFGGPGDSPGVIITKEFKEKIKSAPGQHLLPRWKKRMLRTNPFNENGELCESSD